jgi:gamma-glutamyltranspeptidase / glutathione hydrolase
MKRTMLVSLVLAWGCSPAVAPPAATPAPDTGKRAVAERGMVASAHPLASEAGLDALRAGGNAVDAAVAAAFAIGVVEPMMAGIGGGGSMMIWEQRAGRAEYVDFYATSPAAASPAYDRGAHPARLVAVPGAVAGLLEAHERFGRLPREAVLERAIRLAEDGFPTGSLLARTIADDSAKLARYADAARIFWPGGRPLQPGERLVQPELAATLRRIATEGRDGFHRGVVAEEVLAALRPGGNPMTAADLAGFTPQWRRPVCAPFRRWTVLGAPPPQAGMQVIQALRLLEPRDLRAAGLPSRSPEAMHLLAGALRVAMADRSAVLGDPAHTAVPAAGIVSDAFAAERRPLLDAERAPARVAPGDPTRADRIDPACASMDPFGPATATAAVATADPPPAGAIPGTASPGGLPYLLPAPWEGEDAGGETTHLAVVDAEGNAVSLTYTQGVYFGSGAWAAGTFLNSAMNLFSANAAGPNAMLPHRSPASATVPSLILEDGRVRMVVGSPGAARIPPAVTQSILYVLEYGLDPLEALRMPRIHVSPANARLQYEQGISPEVIADLRRRGYDPEVMPPTSLFFGGVHVIDRRGRWWVGAADPRRDGEVRGW